jgi:hypothetical protein
MIVISIEGVLMTSKAGEIVYHNVCHRIRKGAEMWLAYMFLMCVGFNTLSCTFTKILRDLARIVLLFIKYDLHKCYKNISSINNLSIVSGV